MTLLERELETTANSYDCTEKTTQVFTNLFNQNKFFLFIQAKL